MALIYQPKVYRAQGSTKLVVASGGHIAVESGGIIGMESGSTLELQSGSVLEMDSGAALNYGDTAMISSAGVFTPLAGLTLAKETGSSATNLANHGISQLNPTTNAVYTLSAPVAGVVKVVQKIQATTTLTATIYAGPTTTVTWDGTNTKLLVSQVQSILLVGDSTLRWRFVPSSQYFLYTSDVVASSS